MKGQVWSYRAGYTTQERRLSSRRRPWRWGSILDGWIGDQSGLPAFAVGADSTGGTGGLTQCRNGPPHWPDSLQRSKPKFARIIITLMPRDHWSENYWCIGSCVGRIRCHGIASRYERGRMASRTWTHRFHRAVGSGLISPMTDQWWCVASAKKTWAR